MMSRNLISEKLYAGIFTAALGLFCSMPTHSVAQGGPNHTDPKKETKTVRGCEYEVLPGLAEITSVEVSQSADNSLLKYDEHEVLFTFTPMEGGDVLEILKDAEIEFVLRSRATRIPVGPEYIKQKNLKVGTKYAMNLLQTKNKEACLERYTYESKALDNDLFEAEDNIIPYMKERYATEAAINEADYIRKKEKGAMVVPTEEPIKDVEEDTKKTFSVVDIAEEEGVDITKMTEGQLREYTRLKLEEYRDELKEGNDFGIDETEIRKQVEKEMYQKYQKQIEVAKNSAVITTAPNEKNVFNKKTKATALRKARQEAKEKARLEKLEADRIEKEKIERAEREKKIRARILAEEEAKILAEIEATKTAKEKRLADEVEQAEADRIKKEAAMARLKKIEQEMLKDLEAQAARKQCVFGERISGTIDVVKVSKVKNADESHLKYTEYEVLVQFRPDNYAELNKKDKKNWETLYTFTLDPKSINANPGAGYIRKYKGCNRHIM